MWIVGRVVGEEKERSFDLEVLLFLLRHVSTLRSARFARFYLSLPLPSDYIESSLATSPSTSPSREREKEKSRDEVRQDFLQARNRLQSLFFGSISLRTSFYKSGLSSNR